MARWILAIYQRQIAEHCDTDREREMGVLESALVRTQNLHAYEPDADIPPVAAAHAVGIE